MPATNELLQEGRYRISQPKPGRVNFFEAYDTVRNTNVIVREIPVKLNKVTTVSQQESLRLSFANQAKALTEIDHESLPHVHDFFSEIDRQYLVMEAVDGEDLASLLLRNKKPFAVSVVTGWADELLDALNYLHTHRPSIVHRNIRPQNVNLDPSGKIKLLGVGVESGAECNVADDSSNLRYSPIEQIWPGLDAASQKAITNSYDDRSERILKEPLDARSDIYSLGATLYFLITGYEPVDPLERSIDILEGKLDPLREPSKVDAQIPSEISDVLMKALEIKRENRYDSAMIMRQVLASAIARVQDRENEEAFEQEEAAEIIRRAAQAKNDAAAALAEEQRRQAEAEEQQRQLREAEEKERQAREDEERQRQLRETEERERQVREAEERERQLREAEQRAEAELRAAQEQEAARAEADVVADTPVEDNVLEIPVAAEVLAYREPTSIDEAELAAVLEELEEVEAAAAQAEHSQTTNEHVSVVEEVESDEDVQIFEDPVDLAPQPLTDRVSVLNHDQHEDIFSTPPEKSGFSLPMPAIAGAIGLVVVIAVGGWFAMSGSSEPEKPTQTQSIEVSQPPSEPEPAAEPVTAAQPESETILSTAETPSEQPVAAAKTAPTPAKAKKADATKADKKKAVTVDDLINDN